MVQDQLVALNRLLLLLAAGRRDFGGNAARHPSRRVVGRRHCIVGSARHPSRRPILGVGRCGHIRSRQTFNLQIHAREPWDDITIAAFEHVDTEDA